jgi:hypothetical protein
LKILCGEGQNIQRIEVVTPKEEEEEEEEISLTSLAFIDSGWETEKWPMFTELHHTFDVASSQK